MAQKTVRIQDVARAAGVSTATVSRALSNPDILSERARKAVQDAIRETGYRVNQAARNLRKQRAGALLVLVPNLGNPFFSQILAGISARVEGTDYAVLIKDTEGLSDGQGALVDYVLDSRVDGIISLDGSLSAAELSAFAAGGADGRLVFACEWVADSPLPSVRSDNAEGARLAVRHLHGLGHSRIAHVTGPEGNVLTAARRTGMLEERDRLGLPGRSDWIMRGNFSMESGQAAARRIIAMQDRPSAVFCASDMVAFGLIATLTEAGIRVPQDISVIGFDDIEMSQFFIPALTTIRQDRRTLGVRAAELLLSRLQTPEAEPGEAGAVDLVGVELIARASTAPPAG
ncbi:LacI family DNA-binding transcriptional regulator [Pacificoceanicola onchidii]|uniref:LacI family DNA-binding transcriptional regulator n=1 Tax=Pacificoceanicola onchidii TaxID=2562685 RepID=UPI0010A5625D|nr:LacI family DNA-binding transcriptional regulator [Pacificoceanicola onchidii]